MSGAWPSVTYANGSNTHTVTDALGRSTTYTYTPTYFGIRTPSSSADDYQYTLASYTDFDSGTIGALHVTSATLGSSTWSYSYGGTWPARINTATDLLGHATVFNSSLSTLSNSTGTWQLRKLDSMKDPLNRTTAFAYLCFDAGSMSTALYNETEAEGNVSSVTCDSRGNVTSRTLQPKPGSGLSNIVSSASFQTICTNLKTCNQPDYTIDGRNARTDYTYDPTHGGVLTETLPADGNGIRPQKRYSYAQFYAYVKNSSGALVQAATPVWLPTQVSECHTAGTCTGGSDEIVSSYEYAPVGSVNRLLVRGKVVTYQGVSLRTCYSYNAIGDQISMTTPRAGLSSGH